MPDETPTYDPSTPRVAQTDPFSCSCASTTWMLHSIGVPDSYPDVERALLRDGLVSTELGLLDGSGGALAQWLANRYDLVTYHAPGVSWEWLQEQAGTMPIAMGGANWYHWVGVRGVDGEGNIQIANPAAGYRGIYDTLTEANFQALGPFAAVWIAVEEVEDMARIADLEQQVADADSLVGVLKDAGRVARENIEQALAVEGLPAEAQDALANGALPAAATVERGGAPADGG